MWPVTTVDPTRERIHVRSRNPDESTRSNETQASRQCRKWITDVLEDVTQGNYVVCHIRNIAAFDRPFVHG